MKNNSIQPVLVGRGMAGQAMIKSLAIASQRDAELKILPLLQVERGTSLRNYISSNAKSVLFLANPSGLHAQSILEGQEAGYDLIAVDKPVCTRFEDVSRLRPVKAPVTVFHGYRVAWGPKLIKQMIEAGEFGEIFSIETRYWQSSSAQMVLKGVPDKRAWKSDAALNGAYDALTDLGSHAVDMTHYLMGEKAERAFGWLGYRNAPAPHRDTHVHLNMAFSGNRRALASISKTCHGTTNNYEFTCIGSKGAASWAFLNPDEVSIAAGNKTTILRRETPNPATGMVPFHGLGWLEGYAEITRQSLRACAGLSSEAVPTLAECLDTTEVLLSADFDGDRGP